VPAYSINGELLDFDAIRAFPEVTTSFRALLFPNREGYDLSSFDDLGTARRSGRLLAGRLPDPARRDEALATFVAREERHLKIGDSVDLHLAGPGFTGEGEPPPGPEQRVSIVGITASLGDFASVAGAGLVVTKGFADAYADRSSTADLFMFVLRRHADDLPAFRRHMSELTGGKPVLFVEAQNDYRQVQRSFHVQAEALWILAAFLALVSVLVLTQTLARLSWLESRDHATLSALGMQRTQRLALAAWRGLFIGGIAGCITTAVTVAASGLMPFGRPRMAETSPGLSFPAVFVIGGFVATLGIVFLQSALPDVIRRGQRRPRPSRVSGFAEAVPNAAASAGLRMALEPGRGADAVPVRSGLAGLTLGLLAVVMSLTVSASLAHLLDTPRLYGWGWDTTIQLDGAAAGSEAAIEATPGVAAVGYGTVEGQVAVGSIAAEVMSLEPGAIQPVLLQGRAPTGDDEVAMARKTLRTAHAHVGSVVPLTLQGQDEVHRMRVTGVVVLPVDSDISSLGEGVLMTGDALRRFIPDVGADTAFVRYAPGADVDRVRRDLAAIAGKDHIYVPTEPSTLVDFGRVRSLPIVLAALLAALGLATITHVLVSSVHRRRRDLAVLRTMGFTGRDIRAVVIWQALTLGVLSLALAIPLGVAAGRAVWTGFARDIGFVGEPITGLVPIAAVAAGVVVLSVVMAAQVARGAAATHPATVLRSE
jgi:ABC-type lipoprotein release transport system permease subunit